MIHESKFTIRTFHTDAFGHVNNSRYVELLEEARWLFAEDIGLVKLLREQGLGFIIIDMRLRFRAPVHEGETIRVETSLVAIGSQGGAQWQSFGLRRNSKQNRLLLARNSLRASIAGFSGKAVIVWSTTTWGQLPRTDNHCRSRCCSRFFFQ